MRPQKVQEKDILIGLTQVFRSQGYEGASLAELAEATGLKKASLYHRFPKGKKEMAEAVLAYLGTWVSTHIFEVLCDEKQSPEVRLENGLKGIRTLYDHGNEVCIFRALSMQTGLALFEQQLQQGMTQWIDAFRTLGIAFALSTDTAQQKAVQVLVSIQGSLIVSKGLDDISIFEHTVQQIENMYLNT